MVVGWLIGLLSILVIVPMAVFCLECLLGLLPKNKTEIAPDASSPRPRTAVLVPAHNEEMVIGQTLASVTPQLGPCDRLMVVADNCTDSTAELAHHAGATVVERQDLARRGKSYALEHGVRHLADDPPEVVIILDADCQLHDGALAALTRQAVVLNRPAQGIYLMQSPTVHNWQGQVAAFGILIKNLVRPMGLARLGLPCGVNGSGLALPWNVLQKVSLASGHIVEDLQLGLDLAEIGSYPLFCDRAMVTSYLPRQDRSVRSQRTRWEHGTLHTLVTRGPWLLWRGMWTRRLSLIAMALGLLVPPLTLLLFLWAAVLATALAWAVVGGSWMPVIALGAMGGWVMATIIAVWAKYSRRELPALRVIRGVPLYVVRKIPIYASFLIRRQTEWVRTDRAGSAGSEH